MRRGAAFTQQKGDIVSTVELGAGRCDMIVVDICGGCRRIVAVRTRPNVDAGRSTLKGAAGLTVVHQRDVVVGDGDVEHRRQKCSAVPVVGGENGGVLGNICGCVPDGFDGGGGGVFRMDIDGAAGTANALSPDVCIVVDAALDNSVVDPEDVDDGTAAAVDFFIAIDIEVNVRRIFRIDADRSPGSALRVEHVAGIRNWI